MFNDHSSMACVSNFCVKCFVRYCRKRRPALLLPLLDPLPKLQLVGNHLVLSHPHLLTNLRMQDFKTVFKP